VKPALNADLDPTGRAFKFPDCPGCQGFKFGYSQIAVIDNHCFSVKLCGEGARGAANLMTKDKARKIAAGIAKLTELLRK
jgi:hypothetical protein